MNSRFILTQYIDKALSHAVYEKLEDNTYAGRIPLCKGVLCFAKTRSECEVELQSVLEDWIWLGLKLGHHLPIIEDIDLNQEPKYEPVDTM